MKYHYPEKDVHLKFRLKKHKIGHVYDFKHNYVEDTYKLRDPEEVNKDMLAIYDTNRFELSNILGIDLTIHDLEILINSLIGDGISSTVLLELKLNRLKIFYLSLIHYIFELTHMLYYTKFNDDNSKEKSGKTFQLCLEVAIDIGMDIRRKYEAIFDKEFNASPAIIKYLESLKKAASE